MKHIFDDGVGQLSSAGPIQLADWPQEVEREKFGDLRQMTGAHIYAIGLLPGCASHVV